MLYLLNLQKSGKSKRVSVARNIEDIKILIAQEKHKYPH